MKSKEEVYTQAVAVFGDGAQKLMAIEEMAELMDAIAKDLRGRSLNLERLAEEVVDVEAMIWQIKFIYGLEPEFLEPLSLAKARKLEELIKFQLAHDDIMREAAKKK